MNDKDIREYVDRAQPFIYAGAYAIQEEGEDLVTQIDGRLDTVIGLPMDQVSEGLETLLGTPPLESIQQKIL
jgi:septum formation protein